MITKRKLYNRVLSLIVCIAMVFGMVPLTGFPVVAADTGEIYNVVDPSTIDQWKQFFPVSGDITTQNAGGVWTDKSVFNQNTTIDGQHFNLSDVNNFLVALSAIGSNMTVTGMNQVPTDVMFVLDVSGSMDVDRNNAAKALVDSTNASMRSLLNANPYTRVGVVLYSGDSSASASASVLLPLASYRTDDAQGEYLNYVTTTRWGEIYSETIRVDSDVYSVVIQNGEEQRQTVRVNSRQVTGGTYIQAGLDLAQEQFLAANTTATPEGMGTVNRKPVIVLMSDGAVSRATTSFDNIGNSNMGSGSDSSTTYAMGFVTQLTAAHTKYMVSQKYGNECLFYTVGMLDPNYTPSYSNNAQKIIVHNVANGVFDPANSCTQLVEFWEGYAQTAEGEPYALSAEDDAQSVVRVTDKVLAEMPMNYVNGFYDANDYASGGSLGDGLADAFEAIVAKIALQTVYHPTLVENGSADLSGYVSFIDKLGEYMQVADVKGLMSGGNLFTGEKLAVAFYEAFANGGGDLGSGMGEGSPLGVAFMDALTIRLGVDRQTAFAILQNAWRSGDIAYDPNTGAYSNSFGWVSDSNGAYLRPWNETDNGSGTNYHIIPQNAAYVNKSYIFLGTEGDTDMMYATVRVREKVENGTLTGEQEVDFAIPASLLPTITYNVELDEAGEVTNIAVEADTPIHLIYEVGLDPEINKFNVKDKVSAEYLAANTDAEGNILFYTNAWDRTNATGYNTVNTYSYFRPSQQNDRYYYQNDSLVYLRNGNSYSVYDGASHPENNAEESYYYYYYYYYAYIDGQYQTVGEYHIVPRDVLSVAVANANGTWSIKAGTIRSDYANADAEKISKTENRTGTLDASHEPFVDSNSYAYDDTNHRSVVGVTMGNNGRLALTPETGIRLSKNIAADETVDADAEFTFEISYSNITSDLEAYAYRFVDGELTGDMETVSFSGGKATVILKAGETLYIGGMDAGTVTVTEETTMAYVVQTVSIDGAAQVGDTAIVTLKTGDMRDINFVNARRGTGVLNVAKSVRFPEGVSASAIAGHKFDVNITLVWNGEPLTDYKVTDASGVEHTTDEAGKLTVTLSHGEQATLYNIPEGTVATVQEQEVSLPGYSAAPVYWVNGTENTDLTEATVAVEAIGVADVMIRNTYAPTTNAEADFEIRVIKNFFMMSEGNRVAVSEEKEFTFHFTLQRETASGWEDVDTAVITYGADNQEIQKVSDAFANSLANQTYSAAGIYRYRILESLGSEGHITYDERTHSFGVQVEDRNADGAWEIVVARTATPDSVSVSEENGVYKVTATFENEYDVQVGTIAIIEINKTVNDPSGAVYKPSPVAGEEDILLAEGFAFMVYEQDGTTPAEGVTAQVTNSGGVARFTLNFAVDTKVGSYNYVIKELGTAGAGWTYAAAQYVTVDISTDAGALKAVAYLNNSDFSLAAGQSDTDNAVTVPFVNTYAPDAASLALDFVNKQLNGREFNGDSFAFKMEGVNGSVIYGADGNAVSGNVITGTASAQSGHLAEVSFADSLYFHKVGTYYYAVSETSTDGNGITADGSVYRITVTVTDNGSGTLHADYTVTSVTGNEITFVNTYSASPVTLTIEGSKTLTGRVLRQNDFVFVLTDNAGNVVDYAVNAQYGTNSSSFAFDPITYRTTGTYTYTVREFDPAEEQENYFNGVSYDDRTYTVVVTVADDGKGNLTASYTVDGDTETVISFENTYKPNPVAVRISGIKEILGRGIVDADSFTFELYEATRDADGTWRQGDKVESVQNIVGSVTFKDLEFTEAGAYRYMVSEVKGDQGGIKYDETVWRVLIDVTDDGNGNLNYEIYYMNADGVQNVMIFLNEYSVADGSVSIEGEKILNGKDLADGQFTFDLYETDDTFTIAEGAAATESATNGADGAFSIKLDYTKEDIGKTFYYVLIERNAGKIINGISYSDRQYQITVTVEDGLNGILKIQKTVVLLGQEEATISFTNEYTASDTSIQVEGDKVLQGRPLKDQEFSFELYAADENWIAGEKLETVQNAADGRFVFAALNYNAVGTYRYIVVEQVGATDIGIEYDETEYRVLVEVTDNGTGALVAEATYLTGDGEVDKMVFNNIYTIASGNLTIEGNKILTGRDLRNEEFTFELYAADENFNISGSALQSAKNGADGKFSFAVEYTKDDAGKTFYYVVKEVNTGANGVTYSTDAYCITVTVADNGSGKLTITTDMTLDGEIMDAVAFVNKYAAITTATVEINKVVENKGSESITPEGFEFLLALVGSDETVKVTTDADGKAVITLNFSEADIGKTLTYKLSEIAGDKPHVTYDGKVYTFTVTVGLDAEDNLVATVKFGEETIKVLKAEFVNVYDYTPEGSENPPTSDHSNLGLWLAMMFVSGGCFVATTVYGKKRRAN